MIDIYVLDKNLLLVGIIDAYKSLIWANRYHEIGDCELYLEASAENISMLRDGYYLIRADDDMVCQIRKIEIDTSTEEGNYLIVTGTDTKAFMDQRVIWSTMNCNGNLEDFIRLMVEASCCTPVLPSRQFQKSNGQQLLFLGDKANFSEVTTEQVSYKNVGEKIREYCSTFKWGYRVVLSDGVLRFQLYKGSDRSNEVIFSDDYENLSTSKYVDDKTNLGNVALVAGSGEGPARSRTAFGSASGVDRFEIYVDAKDINKTISWSELTSIYPLIESGGRGYISQTGSSFEYMMEQLDIQVVDENQLIWLNTYYPTGRKWSDDYGNTYYRVFNEAIAELPSATPQENDEVTLQEFVYMVYLLNRGAEKTAEYGELFTFEGSVVPDVTFIYKKDYFLGDIVTVENEYGITASVRIVEVVEVMDENGYSIEPKFEMEVL